MLCPAVCTIPAFLLAGEYNPGAFTNETLATSTEGYETLINQCYFAMERFYYGAADWMSLTEGDTDLWTYKANQSTSYTEWFWFFAGTSPNTTYINNWWNGTYDGIGSCNEAIALGDKPPYATEEERNAKVAEARFMRAVYYFNAVEQFGGVTMLTEPETSLNYSPVRTDPMTIYKEVILPDLRFASEWLSIGNHATTTTPTKKAALGFLAKACLQTYEYGSTEYLQEALDAALQLISDCESGGGNATLICILHTVKYSKKAITGKTRKRSGNIAGMQARTDTVRATVTTS